VLTTAGSSLLSKRPSCLPLSPLPSVPFAPRQSSCEPMPTWCVWREPKFETFRLLPTAVVCEYSPIELSAPAPFCAGTPPTLRGLSELSGEMIPFHLGIRPQRDDLI
jgi:hypothetical protein